MGHKPLDESENETESTTSDDVKALFATTGGDAGRTICLDMVVDDHTKYASLITDARRENSKTVTDRVNGLLSALVKCAPELSGVDRTTTNVEFNGANTNVDRGLMYTDGPRKRATDNYRDSGPVPDGDVDRTPVADNEGNAADGD